MVNIRTGAAAVILSAMLALTGCAGPGVNPAASSGDESGSEPSSPRDGDDASQQHDSNPSASADDATPRGFQFESGFLEFGEFDPYTLGDDIFNPCTEITEEEFAAAGFEQMEYYGVDDPFNRGIASCDFASNRKDAVGGGFYGGVINRRVAEEQGLVMPEHQSKVLPELYTLPASTGIEGACYTQIDTPRGAFGTHAGGSPRRITTDEACALAIEYAERIFLRYGRFSDKN